MGTKSIKVSRGRNALTLVALMLILIASRHAIAQSTAPATQAATTQPQGQDSPVDALSKLCAAMELDDWNAIDECLCDEGDNPDQAGIARAWLKNQASVYRIEKAWINQYHVDMTLPNWNFNYFSGGTFEILLQSLLDGIDGPPVKIDGDTALVQVPQPHDPFTGGAAQWVGATLTLIRKDGIWRLDTDATFVFAVSVSGPNGKTDGVEMDEELQLGFANGLKNIAAQIEAGKLATRGDAVRAVQNMGSKVLQGSGVTSEHINIKPFAPANH